VSSWSNRFVSLAALALVGCHSTPRHRAPQAPQAVQTPAPGGNQTAQPAAAAKAGAAASGAAATGAAGSATPKAAAANAAPVPERAAQQYSQALNMMKSGRTADAQLEFKQLSLAYPEFAGPELNLGLLYLRESHYTEAEGAFKAAIQRNPDSAVANNELGITERKLGKFAEAEAAYQRTIALEPNYAPAYLNLGVLYDLYLSEPQKALEQFEHYLTLAGDNKQVAGWVIELRKRVGPLIPAAKKEPA
jgi:tetratricopeptide (TPR) repeat protein